MHHDDDPADPIPVRHEREQSRFVADLPGGQAELRYGEFAEDVLDLQHTEVPPAGRGRGVGEALIRAALAYARERGVRVMATCPYVQSWLRRHPDQRPA